MQDWWSGCGQGDGMTTVIQCNKCKDEIPSEQPGQVKLVWTRFDVYGDRMGFYADLCDKHYNEAFKMVKEWLDGNIDFE